MSKIKLYRQVPFYPMDYHFSVPYNGVPEITRWWLAEASVKQASLLEKANRNSSLSPACGLMQPKQQHHFTSSYT
jgi:hypothetical protein